MKINSTLAEIFAIILAASSLSLYIAPASAQSAPSCVTTNLNDRGYTDHLRVTNGCKKSVRVKVVLAFKTDKACQTLSPGVSRDYQWSYPGRFDRLEAC